jgi:hypothetical protein
LTVGGIDFDGHVREALHPAQAFFEEFRAFAARCCEGDDGAVMAGSEPPDMQVDNADTLAPGAFLFSLKTFEFAMAWTTGRFLTP